MTDDQNKPPADRDRKAGSEKSTPKKPEFSPTRGGFEIGPTEPTPKAKGESPD